MTENYQASTPWEETAADRVEQFAATLGSRAQGEAMRVTHPGEGSDMNAALVHAIRQATLQGVQLDLAYLANDVRKLAALDTDAHNRASQQAAQNAYNQGLVEGVEKGKSYQQRDQADAAERLAYGNPAPIRDLQTVITPRGHVAAWRHEMEQPDGSRFFREVYGTLDADVREGDTRAVIVAGPDKHLISLDRVRFAPTLHALVAERDLSALENATLIDTGTGVRLQDGMDGGGHLDANITTLDADGAAEGSKPGTYVRLVSVRPGNGRVTLDMTVGQWTDLVDAVEALYARRVIAQAEGDES